MVGSGVRNALAISSVVQILLGDGRFALLPERARGSAGQLAVEAA